MSHDPLCPDSDPNRWVSKDFNGNSMSCRCEEYSKVREEERAAALDAAEKAVADIDGEEMCCACNDDYRMTIAAIRALKEKP